MELCHLAIFKITDFVNALVFPLQGFNFAVIDVDHEIQNLSDSFLVLKERWSADLAVSQRSEAHSVFVFEQIEEALDFQHLEEIHFRCEHDFFHPLALNVVEN